MDCREARVYCSAALDGQLDEDERRLLDAHLQACAECERWHARLADLARRTRLVDAAGRVPAGVMEPVRAARNRGLRLSLAWAGILLIVWHVSDVIAPGGELAVHLARHQAGFAVALGVGFVFVAWRPDRAYGTLPLVAGFTIVLSVVAVVDVVSGASDLAVESRHLLEIGGLAIMWLLALEMGPGRRPRRRWSRDDLTDSRR